MTKPIQRSVRFGATPAQLFEMYMDSGKHSAATGKSHAQPQSWRKVHGMGRGTLRGRNLVIVPNRLIVQSWSSINFKASDLDSILSSRIQQSAWQRRS